MAWLLLACADTSWFLSLITALALDGAHCTAALLHAVLTYYRKQDCARYGLLEVHRPYAVRNPENQSDAYAVHSWECGYADGSLDGTDDVLVREWQQHPESELKPMLFLAPSLDRARVRACTQSLQLLTRRLRSPHEALTKH
jgi:hypothetical protein